MHCLDLGLPMAQARRKGGDRALPPQAPLPLELPLPSQDWI